MRIKRIVLEHHRDIPVLGLDVIHLGAADKEATRCDLLQARDHAERRTLAATGRTNEHHELFVRDLQIKIRHRAHAAFIHFIHVFEQ